MQYARLLDDGQVWEAEKFSRLSASDIEMRRRNLVCVECAEFAWYRKESAHGHPPHFCAHHTEDCALRVLYTVVGDPLSDGTELVDQVADGESIIVRLDEEQGGTVDVVPVQPPSDGSQTAGGTRFVGARGHYESSQHFTLRRILFRLVQSPTFRESDREIIFYRNAESILIHGQVRNVVVEFSRISADALHDRILMFWGPIASAGRTQDGKFWLNSSEKNQGASIAIFPDIVDDFLEIFDLKSAEEELPGAHVLVAGRCTYSQATGKPVIWCGSPKYIFVRRYRDEQFEAKL